MKWKKSDIARWSIALLLAVAAITIASLTIGRDIYNGTRDDGLLSFAIVSLSGYLFFLFIPVELAFVYYLPGEINVWALNAVALGTAMVSQTIDYTIGYMLSGKIIDRFIGKKRYEKAEERIRKYGNAVIFIFNFFPLSSPVISLAAGMLKHRVKDALIFTFTGLLTKYLLLTLLLN